MTSCAKKLIRKGRKQAASFSWARTAEAVVKVYEEVGARRSGVMFFLSRDGDGAVWLGHDLRLSALAGLARPDTPGELCRLAARNAQALPVRTPQMLRQKNDLSAVVGVVCELAIDALHHGMRLAADGDGAREIAVAERLKRGEHACPSLFRTAQQRFPRGWRVFEFRIAIAPGLVPSVVRKC